MPKKYHHQFLQNCINIHLITFQQYKNRTKSYQLHLPFYITSIENNNNKNKLKIQHNNLKMHNYVVQNRYSASKIGNWYEENQLKDHQFKEYLYQKNTGNNLCLNNQSKLAFSNQQVQLTKDTDGFLHAGDWVMLFSLMTEGVIAFNVNQAILGEETYAVTTAKAKGPVLRNTLAVQPVNQTQSDVIRYGDKVRFVTYINQKKFYLQSIAVSPMRSSKFSRHQQVSVTSQLNSNSIWVFQHINPKLRFDSLGQPITITDQLLIKHNSTSQWLASDKINYINEFGAQYQTFAKSFLNNNKTQNLFAEKVGHKSVEQSLRGQGVQNSWQVVKGN